MNDTTDERAALLHAWIKEQLDIVEHSFSAVSGDASFRRYFRFMARHAYGLENISLIAVDAPPELENCQPFIDIALLLANHHIPVPKIYSVNLDQGFYIQQDFGDCLMLDVLNQETSDNLYKTCMNEIVSMQTVGSDDLPLYNLELLQREMHLFSDWYLKTHLSLSLDDKQAEIIELTYALLEKNALEQPQVFVHRDYHSRNLMLLDDNNIGIIDFQDAVKGPITYDLVSLLRDCYVTWPQENVEQWLCYFYEKLDTDFSLEQFTRWFDLMGIQRHLKATGIFCRLNYRDGKSSYLNDIPRTLNYIFEISKKYPELAEFNLLLKKIL